MGWVGISQESADANAAREITLIWMVICRADLDVHMHMHLETVSSMYVEILIVCS